MKYIYDTDTADMTRLPKESHFLTWLLVCFGVVLGMLLGFSVFYTYDAIKSPVATKSVNRVYVSNMDLKRAYVYSVSGYVPNLDFKAEYIDTIRYYDLMYGVPDSISFRIIKHESNFRKDVVDGVKRGSRGEIGMFQLMPSTVKALNEVFGWRGEPTINHQIRGAIWFLRMLYDSNGLSWRSAISHYGCGRDKKNYEFVNFVLK
jgi:hypothetical protein